MKVVLFMTTSLLKPAFIAVAIFMLLASCRKEPSYVGDVVLLAALKAALLCAEYLF
jgi:hypothetical protein